MIVSNLNKRYIYIFRRKIDLVAKKFILLGHCHLCYMLTTYEVDSSCLVQGFCQNIESLKSPLQLLFSPDLAVQLFPNPKSSLKYCGQD